MTTAAAIDRLVYHSVILELNVPSFRLELASKERSRLDLGASIVNRGRFHCGILTVAKADI
jgi:hypothetical protein